MNSNLKIQLLYFPGCPNVVATRKALALVLEKLSLEGVKIEDVNVHDPNTSKDLQNYPSPTILIDGKDIEGLKPGNSAACRIYDGKGGVPQIEQITTALTAALKQRRQPCPPPI